MLDTCVCSTPLYHTALREVGGWGRDPKKCTRRAPHLSTIPRPGEIVRELLHAFHVRFETWNNFQNESNLKKSIVCNILTSQPGSNQGPPAFWTASLPSELSMFSIHRLRWGPFMCKYMTYLYDLFTILDLFQNITSDTCKIQSSRLDRTLWSHTWWKVVPSPKFVNIIIRNWTNASVSGFAETGGVV